MRELSIQVSFAKGIQENVYQATGDKFITALVLNNYNPFIELNSLVKRYGEEAMDIPLLKTSDYQRQIFDEVQGPENNVVTEDSILGFDINDISYPKKARVVLYVLRSMLTVDNKNYLPEEHLLYYSDYRYPFEASLIYCHAPVFENGEYVNRWYNAFVENKALPGWYPFGTVSDMVRYYDGWIMSLKLKGFAKTQENGKVTSWLPKLDDSYTDSNGNQKEIVEYCVPVVKFAYWDVTKKAGNKIDNEFERRHEYWNGLDLTDLDNRERHAGWKVIAPLQAIKNKRVSIANGRDADNIPYTRHGITLIINEHSLFKNSFLTGNFTEAKDLPKLVTYEIPEHFSAHALLFFGMAQRGLTKRSWWWRIPSRETQLISQVPSTHVTENYFYLKNGKAIRYYHYQNCSELSNSSGWNPNWQYEIGLALKFPDYRTMNRPRPWLLGEKIPLLITIESKGIEYIIHEGSYQVKSREEYHIPSGEHDGNNSVNNSSYFQSLKNWGRETYDYESIKKTKHPVSGEMLRTWFSVCDDDIREGTSVERDLYLKSYTYLTFVLRIHPQIYQLLFEVEASSINVYISSPSANFSILRSEGPTFAVPNSYMKPEIDVLQPIDARIKGEYRLLKKFLIEGAGMHVPSYSSYLNSFPIDNNVGIATNGWKKGDNGFIYSVGQADDGEMVQGKFYPDTLDNLEELLNYDYEAPISKISPDFMIWDYGGPLPLTLSSSGLYWKGQGAGLVNHVKGRIVISQCINEQGDLEVARTRFSAVRGASMSTLFNEEDYIDIGTENHVAIINYREQTWWFTRTGFYRGLLQNPYDLRTFEMLDAQIGQGTFNNRTVIEVPTGVVFLNENGVWYSDGRKPESLSDSQQLNTYIKSLYQKLALNKPYEFIYLSDFGNVPVNEEGYNPYLELTYNPRTDEIVISTPISVKTNLWYWIRHEDQDPRIFDREIRLIYNFSKQGWRTETYPYPDLQQSFATHYSNEILVTRTFGQSLRYHVSYNDLYVLRSFYSVENKIITGCLNEIGVQNYEALKDYYFTNVKRIGEQSGIYDIGMPIIGNFVSHFVGNGSDDYILRKLIVNCTPRDQKGEMPGWQNYVYYGTGDPFIGYIQRSKTYQNQSTSYISVDLLDMNFRPKHNGAINPFLTIIQKPGGINNAEQNIVARESLLLLPPLNSQFRQMNLVITSEILMKINTLTIFINNYRRN